MSDMSPCPTCDRLGGFCICDEDPGPCDICGVDHSFQRHIDSLHRDVHEPDRWTGPQHVTITVRTLDGLLRLAGLEGSWGPDWGSDIFHGDDDPC